MVEFKNQLSWSPSRRRRFNTCKRKYYHRHYGSWGGWEDTADKLTKELYHLSKMMNISMFAGKVVHDTVSAVLEQLQKGKITEQDMAEKMVLQAFKQGWSQSKKKEWKQSPKWKTNLFEHYYNEVPSRDELKKVGDKIVEGIKGFYESESFAFIKTLPAIDWICNEELASFDFEGTTVYIKLDFAARHGDKIYIYDWKTGAKVYEDEVQLAVYSIYALGEWGIVLDSLRLFDVYLPKRLPVKIKVNQPTIDETKQLMRESIAEMKSILDDEEGNVASIDNFPMIDDLSICRLCEFKGVCYPDTWEKL